VVRAGKKFILRRPRGVVKLGFWHHVVPDSITRMALIKDIAAQVQHDFPETEVGPVSEMLDELQREDAQLFCDRILRCLVFVAHGSFTALADAVALARTDYRDLIVSAEYDRHWQPVRDFNEPFGNAA